MAQPTDWLELPRVLDLASAQALHRSLRERLAAHQPPLLVGGRVERVSTPAVQVLVAAAAEARAQGLPFRLHDPSPALADALADLGLWPDLGQSRALETRGAGERAPA